MGEYKSKTFDDFQKHSQLLLASRIFSEYLDTIMTIAAVRRLEFRNDRKSSNFPTKNMEPEYYAEQWIKTYVVGGTKEWREGVFEYFIKLLVNYPNAMNKEEPED